MMVNLGRLRSMSSGMRACAIVLSAVLAFPARGACVQASVSPTTSPSADEMLRAYLAALPPAEDEYRPSDRGVFWTSYFADAEVRLEAAAPVAAPAARVGLSSNVDGRVVAGRSPAADAEAVAPPRLEAILNRSLPFELKTHDSVNKIIGEATCTPKDVRVVVVAKDPNPKYRLNPYGFVFFREHEVAHFERGHIRCLQGQPVRVDETGQPIRTREEHWSQEFDADCAAASVITSFPDGGRVLDRAWSNLGALPLHESDTHPAPQERAKRLDSDEQCWSK